MGKLEVSSSRLFDGNLEERSSESAGELVRRKPVEAVWTRFHRRSRKDLQSIEGREARKGTE